MGDVGSVVGKWYVGEQTGQAGLASTYRVHHAGTGHEGTLTWAEVDAQGERRLEELAAIWRGLQGANLVQLFDGGIERGHGYLVAESVAGESLESMSPMECGRALLVVQALANGLAFMHGKRVVHRDVKPRNVLVPTSAGTALLSDAKLHGFSLATHLSPAGEPAGHVSDNALYGTPRYMSPEQWLGQRVTAASDSYALGATLYELLYGRAPFINQSIEDLARAVLNRPVSFPPRPVVPEPVRAFLTRCLAKDPAQRPPDGHALHGDLTKLIRASLPPGQSAQRISSYPPVGRQRSNS